jgi:hypothetical protein
LAALLAYPTLAERVPVERSVGNSPMAMLLWRAAWGQEPERSSRCSSSGTEIAAATLSGWSDCEEDRSRAEVRTEREWRFGEDFWVGYSLLLFKYGIYISGVSQWGRPIPTQNLYYDEVRIGDTRAEVVVDDQNPVD